VSLNGLTDMLGVVATILLAWLILADWPSGVSRQVGVYLALAAATVIATGAGDFRVTSLFPKLPEGDRSN